MQDDASGTNRQVGILITAENDGFGRLVSEVIEEHLRRSYNLRVTFAERVDELLLLVQVRAFDAFIVVADAISFSSGAPDSSLEDREKRVLQLIRHLKSRYDTPVLALHGWSDLDFGEKIAGADYSIKYPRIYDKLREAVHKIIKGTFDAKAAQKRPPVPERGRGTLLIVDDEVSTCRTCKAFLDSKGFETRTAHSAAEALAILNEIKVDVVITSVQIPDMSGLKFTRLIKKRYDADVILITACTEIGDYDGAARSSAGYLVYRPALPGDMHDRIEQIVRRRKLEKFRRKFGFAGKIKEEIATKFFLSGGACAAGIIPEEEGQELMERLAALRKKVGVPQNEYDNCGPLSPRNPEKYHPNRLLEVFDRLRLMDGCTLDCYCHRFSGFKLPCVYSRETGSAPIKNRKDFNDRFPHRRDRLRHIEIEPSPSGYFQFAVLNQTADQFHLFRHCPFGFTRPVVTDNQLRRILDSIAGNVSIDELEKAREVRARLSAVESEGIVTVRFLTFNPLRGLYFQHTYIRSNMIEHVSKIKIVDCERRLAF